MTNEQIIFNKSIMLMEQGLIGTTGRSIELEQEDGSKKTIMEPVPIHTFAGWKSLGYQVQRGQKAVAKFPIWKYKSGGSYKNQNTGEEESIEEKMFLTEAFFFSQNQVESINDNKIE